MNQNLDALPVNLTVPVEAEYLKLSRARCTTGCSGARFPI
jgi:hypothetical protein